MCYKIQFVIILFLLIFSAIISPGKTSADNDEEYTIAVLNLEPNGVSQVEALGLSGKLRSYFSQLILDGETVKENYQMIERAQMDKIFDQFDIQSTGCVSDSCAVEFGKMLQCDRIVIGTITLIGQTYSVIARIVDVGSGKTIESADRQHKGTIDDVLTSLIPQIGYELLTGERPISPITTGKAAENPFVSSLTITGLPQKAFVFIDGINVGATPVPVQEIPIGKHKIMINKPGYEGFSKKINVKTGTPVNISYTLDPKTRLQVFRKSFLIPGRGQWYAGYKGKGALISVLQATTLGFAIYAINLYQEDLSRYDDAKERYMNAVLQEDIDSAYYELEDTYNDASGNESFQNITVGAALAVYLYNLIDAAITKPITEEEQQKNTFLIEPRIGREHSGIYVSMRF